jgi:hypothetical protein
MNRPLPTSPDLSQERCPNSTFDLSCSPPPREERWRGGESAEQFNNIEPPSQERSTRRDTSTASHALADDLARDRSDPTQFGSTTAEPQPHHEVGTVNRPDPITEAERILEGDHVPPSNDRRAHDGDGVTAGKVVPSAPGTTFSSLREPPAGTTCGNHREPLEAGMVVSPPPLGGNHPTDSTSEPRLINEVKPTALQHSSKPPTECDRIIRAIRLAVTDPTAAVDELLDICASTPTAGPRTFMFTTRTATAIASTLSLTPDTVTDALRQLATVGRLTVSRTTAIYTPKDNS